MSNKIYIKVNGVWREADSVHRKRNGVWQKASDDVYKKINGAWVNQGDKSAIFDQDALFLYNDFRVDENASAHVNVTCFDGGDGFVIVVASGGTPPYQYSTDPTFATYNTDGVFSNLSLVGPVDEGTDEYGGILISHRRFYARDASGQIVSCVVDLKSPVELDWVNTPADMTVFYDPGQDYATVFYTEPTLTTTANGAGEYLNWSDPYKYTHHYPIGITNVAFYTGNECENGLYEEIEHRFTITVLPLYFPNAIQDYDGNWYDAVVIGNQVWLASNLRTTHYADGTPIPAGGSTTSNTDPYYYDYSTSNIPLKDRGYLYNWPAVMNGATSSNLNPSGVQGIAMTGWHVPSDAEWTQMTDYVNSQSVYRFNNENGKIAKALAYNDYWEADSTPGNVGNDQTSNNATMFGAVAAGYYNEYGFASKNYFSWIWSSTQGSATYSYSLRLQKNSQVAVLRNDVKYEGFSIRCVCDLSPLDFAAWYYNEYGSYNHQVE